MWFVMNEEMSVICMKTTMTFKMNQQQSKLTIYTHNNNIILRKSGKKSHTFCVLSLYIREQILAARDKLF